MLKDVDLKDDEAIKHLAWIQRGSRNLCQIKDMKITQQQNLKKKILYFNSRFSQGEGSRSEGREGDHIYFKNFKSFPPLYVPLTSRLPPFDNN